LDPVVDQYELDQNMAQAWSFFPGNGQFHYNCNRSCRYGKNGYAHYYLGADGCVAERRSDPVVVHHSFCRSGDTQ